MARTVRDSKLQTRTSRDELVARGKPYWLTLHEGLHLGYRKGKRGGRWVIRLYSGDGDYITKTIGTADDASDADGLTVFDFRQAQDIAREQSTELVAQKKGVRLGNYTVENALEDYFIGRDGKKRNIDLDKGRAAIYITPIIGNRPINDLTKKELEKWRDQISVMPGVKRNGKPKLMPSFETEEESEEYLRKRKDSANRIINILKAALNSAFEDSDTNVSRDTAWRKLKNFKTTTKARVRYLDIAEVTRLLNAAQGDFRTLVRGALLTGARYGDLAAMDVGDYLPDSGLIMSSNSKASRPHAVYLTDEGVDFFEQTTAGRKKSEPMFIHGDRRWRKGEQTRPMREAIQAARIDPPIGLHGLRHTYASHAIMGGVPPMVIAENLGHKDTRMIEKHYGHISDEHKANAIRAGVPAWGGAEASKVTAIDSVR